MINPKTKVDHEQVLEDFVKKQKQRIKKLKDRCTKGQKKT